MLSLIEITAFRLERKSCKGFFLQIKFPPMRALEFIRDHVTFKLPYDFSYHMKTPHENLKVAHNRPKPFFLHSSPAHSPQPGIDFSYYEISGPDICSLICATFSWQYSFLHSTKFLIQEALYLATRQDLNSCSMKK